MREEVGRLVYRPRSGRGLYLSDVSHLLRLARDAKSEEILLDAVLRRPTLIGRLIVKGSTDVERISKYWTAENRFKEVRPMLESMQASEEIESLDIAHLLPPGVRKRLNTYPTVQDGFSGRFPDWFWTSYNFFHFYSRDVYADPELVENLLDREYEAVGEPHRYGDMLVLRVDGRAVHGCIYIAGDVVLHEERERFALSLGFDAAAGHDRSS